MSTPAQAQRWSKATLQFVEKTKGITIGDITLDASEKSRSLFSQSLVMLREAEALQPTEEAKAAFRESPQMITDKNGKSHTLTVKELRELLVAFGVAYQALWNEANNSPK